MITSILVTLYSFYKDMRKLTLFDDTSRKNNIKILKPFLYFLFLKICNQTLCLQLVTVFIIKNNFEIKKKKDKIYIRIEITPKSVLD